MSLDTGALVAAYGEYYIAGAEENRSRLFSRVYSPSKTSEQFKTIPTNDTRYRTSLAGLSGKQALLQPYQCDFTPNGEVEFVPRETDLGWMKVDFSLCPDDIVQTWAGFLAGAGYKKEEYPLIRYIIEDHLIPGYKDNLERFAAYNGVKAAPVPGVPGTPEEVYDGIRAQINDGVAAGSIVPIVTGALPADPVDFVTAIEAFADEIPERYNSLKMQLYMSIAFERRFKRGMQLKYNMGWGQVANLNSLEHHSITVVGLESMNGSDKIWATPDFNRVRPIRLPNIKDMFRIERNHRKVDIYLDWHEVLFLPVHERIFTNDRDLI